MQQHRSARSACYLLRLTRRDRCLRAGQHQRREWDWFKNVPIRACQRYEFVTTGVGCVIHGDPDCLCDVVVEQPLPVVALPKGFESLSELVEDAERVLTAVET